MRRFVLIVPAGGVVDLPTFGNYVRVKSSAVEVKIESPGASEEVDLSQGDAAILTGFRSLRVSHSDAAAQTVVLQVGTDTRVLSSQVGGTTAISGEVEIKNDSGNPVPVSGTVSATADAGAYTQSQKTVTNASAQLLAAKAGRKFLLVQNKDAAGSIFVNMTGVAATTANGVKIAPGGSLLIDRHCPSAEIRAIGDIASNANIVAVEL